MANEMDSRVTVTLKEILPAQMFESEAPLNVLESTGVVAQGEVLAESERLQRRQRKAGSEHRAVRRTEGRP